MPNAGPGGALRPALAQLLPLEATDPAPPRGARLHLNLYSCICSIQETMFPAHAAKASSIHISAPWMGHSAIAHNDERTCHVSKPSAHPAPLSPFPILSVTRSALFSCMVWMPAVRNGAAAISQALVSMS